MQLSSSRIAGTGIVYKGISPDYAQAGPYRDLEIISYKRSWRLSSQLDSII